MELNAQLYLVLRIRRSRAITPLPHMYLWRGQRRCYIRFRYNAFVTIRVTENGITKVKSNQNKFEPVIHLISSHWALKSRNSQHECAEVRLIHTAFAYLSLMLKPIRISKKTLNSRTDCTFTLHGGNTLKKNTNTHTHTKHTHTHTNTHIHSHKHTHTQMQTHTHTYTQTNTHIHIHPHKHTHTHTHKRKHKNT